MASAALPVPLSVPPALASQDAIDSRLEAAGLRRTRATCAVLDVLSLDPQCALSHAELESGLTRLEVQVNRVTLYRLLDRLVAAGLVTRSVDSQRVSRFAWVGASPENWTPRFECDACHKSFRLADGADKAGAAARDVMRSLEALGHHGVSVDLSVKGTCVECTDPHRAGA